MGADLMLCLGCDPKEALAEREGESGDIALLQLAKRRAQAQGIIAAHGEEALDAEVTQIVAGRDGPEERQTSIREMLSSTDVLDKYAPHCEHCPASIFDERFGCWGYIPYPISESAERWMMSRVQPPDTLGGFLMLAAIDDFGYDGGSLRAWRERGLFELPEAPTVSLATRELESPVVSEMITVSADQIFQALFCIGEPLDPVHCLGVLLWLGALHIGGSVPDDIDPALLRALNDAKPGGARQLAAGFDVGAPSDDAGVLSMQRLLLALYTSWVIDAPLWIDA
ncbi:MAG: hypothetical protein KC503_08130 [Myxococcales bacterium]|nr:hypothetical protein [Myxococcales bacterium]